MIRLTAFEIFNGQLQRVMPLLDPFGHENSIGDEIIMSPILADLLVQGEASAGNPFAIDIEDYVFTLQFRFVSVRIGFDGKVLNFDI